MQEVPTSPICEVVILTALGLEYKAVSEHLQDMREITYQGTVYGYGNFTGQHCTWHVAVAEIGMGGPTAATETQRAISYFRPQITLFVGVGGGLKDVKLGDVVAASKIYAYESGKVEQQFQPRPEVWRASHALEQRARAEARSDQWLTLLGSSCPASIPQVHIGALAAGEKVLASTQSDLFRLLKATYGDTLAVEMEGHGFLAAVHANHSIHALVIRGISDLIDGKSASDATGSQIVAAWHAAAFAFQILAKFVPTFGSTSSSSADPGVWNVPHARNPHFTGRDDLLDRLHQQLVPRGQSYSATTRRVALTQPLAIKGLGGVGKTQITVEYAYRSRDLGHYTHTLWINAASEETIITSFAIIAELLPSFTEKKEIDRQKLVEAVKRWLEQCRQNWLLIFDNADEIALVRNCLPQGGNGSILLTTRANAVGSLATSVEVETMGFIEGTHLLLRRARRFECASDEEINQAGNIVVALDHFPLALDQAAAYIEETQCSLVDYLTIYQKHRSALLARRGALATDYPNSVATTWLLSFQKVQQANPAAAELLHLCAFLAPDQIPEELIKESAAYWPPLLQQAAADLFAFNQMIAELLKFSLVERLTDTQTLSIHRLVQAVQMDMMEQEVQRQWAERVVRAVNEIFPDNSQEVDAWPLCLRYLGQAQVCNTLVEQYQLLFVGARYLLHRAGYYLQTIALYAQAESLYQRVLAISEQELGSEHPDVAASLNNLAVLYRVQGKYDEAEPVHQRALQIRVRQLGPEHPDVAASLNNLAGLYENQGKHVEAEPLYQRALQIYEQQLGPEHLDVASPLNNLAIIYKEQGKYAEAESLYQRALQIKEQQLGSQHLNVAASLNNLASLYREQGKHAQAEPLYQRALQIYEQQLGPEHPDVAMSLSGLANLYYQQGKHVEAEPLYQRALQIYEQQLGPEHLDVASPLNNLAIIYKEQGKYAEAESLYQRALQIKEQQLGSQHPNVATSLNGLANLYREQGKYIEAKPLYQRALQIWEQQLGSQHPNVAASLNNLASLYREQGKYVEAEPLYQQALQIWEQQLGPEHPNIATSLSGLADLYCQQGKHTEAEPLYQRALSIREQTLGPRHWLTRETMLEYVSLLRAMGRSDKAEELMGDLDLFLR